MNTIKTRISYIVIADGLVAVFAAILLFNKLVAGTIYISRILAVVGVLFLILSWILVREYGRYKDARLIMENEILHIQIARIEDETLKAKNDDLPADSVDAHISCFGIILGSKVIKFNTDGIVLKSIDIGPEYISFVYCASGKYKTLQVLHGVINQHKIQDFVERISYETGVIPLISDLGLINKTEELYTV